MISLRETLAEALALSKVQDLTHKTFIHAGYLQNTLDLEHRPEQEAMANAVAEAFVCDSSLLFEAGTGVGKSLAYLIPGIIHALEHKRPFLVSTHTKALQEQIINKDIPLVRSLFYKCPELAPFANFRSTLLMGRSNYLCPNRLATAIVSRTELFPNHQQEELERIAHWSTVTQTGVLEELTTPPSHEVWEWVNADSSLCNPKNCNPNECFYQKAKMLLNKSNVIVLNHSLLFALISAGMTPNESTPGILFPEDFLVLDEAHTVPDIATDHFGFHLSSYGIDRALKFLYNPRTKKGLLTKFGTKLDYNLVMETIVSSEEFFNLIRTKYLQNKDKIRLLTPEWIEPILSSPLKTLIDRLTSLANAQTSDNIKETIQDACDRIYSYYSKIHLSLILEPEDHVHWIEKSGKSGHTVTIRSAPIHVAPYITEAIFSKKTSSVLTSATLASSAGLDNFKEKVGAQNVEGQIEASPFDFEKNCQIYIDANSTPPSETGSIDRNYLAEKIKTCALKVEGGSLVLFTSYADMSAVANLLESNFAEHHRPFFVQGRDLSRMHLINAFKEAGNAILFGTDSFWTGIDVPGSALSQVIITRLPFENPSDPIKQAQAEWYKEKGLNPFIHLTLPEAVIQFRQGIGRLIRNKTDKGIITILDSRILNKPYGKSFLTALPKKKYSKLDIAFIN